MRTDFYRERIQGRNQELTNRRFRTVEELFYRDLVAFRGEPGAILRWSVNCSPRGEAAHWRKSYDRPRRRVVDGGRAVSRRLFPDWWV